MPLRILADGFFQPERSESEPRDREDGDAQFVTCGAAAAVQATWSRVAVVSGEDPDEEVEVEVYAVVYVGDPDAPLDNDRMYALRNALPEAFEGDTVVIASSPEQGKVELHTELTGDRLLKAAAVVGVVQAKSLWDQSDPLMIHYAHRNVECRPRFDGETRLWSASVERR